MIRKLLILFGLWVTYTQVNIFVNSIWPDKVKEEITVETGESATSGTSTTTTELPEPEPEKPWEPLNFTGEVGNFAKEHDGKVIKIKGGRFEKQIKTSYGMKPKEGVVVSGDLYFRYKRKNYVIHKGKLIKL